MVDDNTPCIAGCQIYSGNERKHHKDCPHYPESFSKRFDILREAAEKAVSHMDEEPAKEWLKKALKGE